MIADTTKSTLSDYLDLYKYLSVLTEEQITKLRRIAVGMLPLTAFSEDEVEQLDRKHKSRFA
jgi:hypothetical protein